MIVKKRPKKIRQMNRPVSILFALSAVFVGVAIISSATSAKSATPPLVQQPVAPEDDMVLIPTPMRPIAKGEKLSAIEFSQVRWPKSRLVGDYVVSVENYKDAVTTTPLPKLLPIPVSAISKEPLQTNSLLDGIPETMRAITVKVDAEAAVEGWALPGNHVDVIVIRAAKDSEIGLEAKIIAENVRILSAGRSTSSAQGIDGSPKSPSTVTLLVSQEDALKIKTAANIGKLNFSLRGTGDALPAQSIEMNQKKLLGGGNGPIRKTDPYKGFAKGPDGKSYVLSKDSRWIKAHEGAQKESPAAQTEEAKNNLQSPTTTNE